MRINPGYARGYIGLGNTWYDQFDATGRAQLDLLAHAIASYERAAEAPFRPGGRVMEAKIAVSLGNGYLVRAQTGAAQAGDFDRAATAYQPVVDWYERGDDQLNDFAAQSLLGLGLIAERGRGDTHAAEGLYRRSLAAASAGSIYQAQAQAMLDAMSPGGAPMAANSPSGEGGLLPYMPLSSPATAATATPTAVIPGRAGPSAPAIADTVAQAETPETRGEPAQPQCAPSNPLTEDRPGSIA